MRCIGKGAESAVMFCGIMNLPPPPTKFTKFNNILLQAARETCEESMAEAVHEAVEENEGGRDIAVAVDGSWQKRGFSSKNGVVTVTSVDTVQKECYSNEETRKNLRGLQVFEDEEGILRLKSRLINEEESKYFISPIILPSKHLADIPLNNVSDLDQIENTNIVLRWRYIQKIRENLKQRFKREYLGFLRSSVTKREDKINVGDIVLIGTDDKKRLHWLLGRVLELFPGKDGIIRLVKLRTEKGNVLRPIQRLYPLELKPNCEQVVSKNRKGPEVVTEYPELNTDSNKTVPVTSSGREIKPVKRLDL
ncbi:bel12-ag transposon polyprotein [Nephila pilipes]|uniref:Bel12-ag transposon polyprotein n=1 Tax=Nephila pilipes TaxID=299642 RepID=A0A8X6U2Q7_NEPPI|nr:bel12-ag transposon polyprotein [Nephila pilipes]